MKIRRKDVAIALMIFGALWFAGVIWWIGGYDEGGIGETMVMCVGAILFAMGAGMLLPDRQDSGD